jgi:hypothetical protein
MSAGAPSPLPGPLDGGTLDGGALDGGALERRYRRLLGLYPPSWRAGRLEEVLAVLLACAEPDRSWPTVRDGADLVRHALAERVRLAGRSVSSDDRRSGVARAGIVAFALLSALSLLQLIVLVPDPNVWSSYQLSTGPQTGAGLAMLASAACVIGGGMWLARWRRVAIVAMVLADLGFLVAALQLRNGFFAVPWPLITGILGLAAVSTVLVVSRAASDAGRALIGARGAVELVGVVVLVAELAGWRHVALGSSLYGPGVGNANYHTIPHAVGVVFLVAAAGALVLAPRNPVPLIAATVRSPLLLAGAIAAAAQAWVFGNADVAVHLASAAIPLGVVALLALASALAVRRAAPG